MFTIDNHIYSINDINLLLNDEYKFIKDNKKIEYLNVPVTFDIESTSFYEGDDKRACMYAWVFGINGKCIIGRTWEEFFNILNKVADFYSTNENRRIICYIHNLAYEFQFIQHYFNWVKIFALEKRKPVKCLCDLGIEFRCSYLLSGYSLAYVGKNLTTYKVLKMEGDLDYTKKRTSSTPLTDKELGYILNDGLVVMAYIQERINADNGIINIPLTKTGYVRKYCRNECLYDGGHSKNVGKYLKYHKLMLSMQITSLNEYEQLKRAFQGGFTHANAMHSNKIISDVTSFDFTSSYPSVMVAERGFPMSSGKLITIKSKEDFKHYINNYCCLFDITLYDLESITHIEHPISISKCYDTSEIVVDNGRVVSADELTTTITEQDYFIYRKFYKWSKMIISNFRIYLRGYLPTNFVKSILNLYHDKTTLKDVEGMEVEYIGSKEKINASFGMAVTDICRNDILYTTDMGWCEGEKDKKEMLKKYNLSKNRFMFYAWGIWITALARRNLFTGIYESGNDFCYADTDSIKITNADKHLNYINDYNIKIKEKLIDAMNHHHLSLDLVHPKTINGVEKWLGVWDLDGKYKKFKTLGAKRYLYLNEEGKYNLTCSGVNKRVAVPYLLDKYGDNIFNAFDNELVIPRGFSGRNIHTYIDDYQEGTLIDYLGIEGSYKEFGSVHIEESEYSLSLSEVYLDYLLSLER